MKYKKRRKRLETRRQDHERTIKDLASQPQFTEHAARKAFKCPGSMNK